MMKTSLRSLLAILPLLLLRAACPALGDDSIIEIRNVPAGELQSVFFTVGRDLAVQIEAVGAQWETGDHMFVYPWIIDAHKRTLVWSMDEEITARVKGTQWLRSYKDRVNLKPGMYELFFYAGRPGF